MRELCVEHGTYVESDYGLLYSKCLRYSFDAFKASRQYFNIEDMSFADHLTTVASSSTFKVSKRLFISNKVKACLILCLDIQFCNI